jgi:hypothetical protein
LFISAAEPFRVPQRTAVKTAFWEFLKMSAGIVGQLNDFALASEASGGKDVR